MKETQWDDSVDDSKEFFDATEILGDDETEAEEESVKPISAKTQFTDLRRRIEERLDSKRIDHEFDFDELDSLLDSLN